MKWRGMFAKPCHISTQSKREEVVDYGNAVIIIILLAMETCSLLTDSLHKS